MSSSPIGDEAWRARQTSRRRREWLLQGALALLLLALAGLFAHNVSANLAARQIKSGFSFLADPAGFNIGELMFDYSARDSYLLAFAAGMANTLRVALAGIVLASALGVGVGLMRLARHPMLNALGAAYVELFRNVPLLIQLLAIYLLITELLPDSNEAWAIAGAALLSKEGLQIAVPEAGGAALSTALAALVLGGGASWAAARRWLTAGAGLFGVAGGLVAALLAWLAAGALGGWSKPVLDGFLISGGASLTPEFLALWLGLSLFTSGSIAELIRAGALAVPAGQTHAALALGLRRGQAMGAVILPQALRLVIPPLASQYMNLVKNSSLAVVIGYPDLVSIGNTSINQNGQALEVILIIMAVYLMLNLVIAVVMNAVNARVTRAPR
ncbi:MAG TPA: ABC transporter permease subunit [Burkholderiaceae bacterium]|jgi:general L-amino acid transport system permease protein